MTDTVNVPREATREMLQACLKAMRADNFSSPKRIWAAMLEADPKVEQEPVAWLVTNKASGAKDLSFTKLADLPFNRSRFEATPLYTHPAPASAELLEVLKLVDLSLQAMADEGIIANGSWAFVTDAIDNHKRLQS